MELTELRMYLPYGLNMEHQETKEIYQLVNLHWEGYAQLKNLSNDGHPDEQTVTVMPEIIGGDQPYKPYVYSLEKLVMVCHWQGMEVEPIKILAQIMHGDEIPYDQIEEIKAEAISSDLKGQVSCYGIRFIDDMDSKEVQFTFTRTNGFAAQKIIGGLQTWPMVCANQLKLWETLLEMKFDIFNTYGL